MAALMLPLCVSDRLHCGPSEVARIWELADGSISQSTKNTLEQLFAIRPVDRSAIGRISI
jgi:hypothetical protein